jgi:hypothetical protein
MDCDLNGLEIHRLGHNGKVYKFIANSVAVRSGGTWVTDTTEAGGGTGSNIYAVSRGLLIGSDLRYTVARMPYSGASPIPEVELVDFTLHSDDSWTIARKTFVFTSYIALNLSVKSDKDNDWVMVHKRNPYTGGGGSIYAQGPYLWRYDRVCNRWTEISTKPQICGEDTIDSGFFAGGFALVKDQLMLGTGGRVYNSDDPEVWPFRCFMTDVHRKSEICPP